MLRQSIPEQVRLVAFRGGVSPDVLSRTPLSVEVEVVMLDLAPSSEGMTAGTVSIEFRLLGSDNSIAGSLEGTQLVLYHRSFPPSLDEAREFAATCVLGDAWSPWRSWVISTLAAMGLGPPPLPPHRPDYLLDDAHLAFDATQEAKTQGEEAR